jgi:hypothetical protein
VLAVQAELKAFAIAADVPRLRAVDEDFVGCAGDAGAYRRIAVPFFEGVDLDFALGCHCGHRVPPFKFCAGLRRFAYIVIIPQVYQKSILLSVNPLTWVYPEYKIDSWKITKYGN